MVAERIPAEAAKWLVEHMYDRGIDLKDILEDSGLDESWFLEREPGITYGQYCRIVMNCLDKSADSSIGLSAYTDHNYLSRLGFWGYALISAQNWDEANKIALEYWSISGSLVHLDFRKTDKLAVWEIFPASPLVSDRVLVFAVEKVVAASFATIQFLTGSPPPLVDISLSYPEPIHAHLYKQYFNCPVKFKCDTNVVRMEVSVLQRRLRMTSPHIAEMCKRQCQELLRKYCRSDPLIHMIRKVVVASRGQFPKIKDVADELGLGTRTLRRRLTERNTSYKAILDEVRAQIASNYLTGTRLSIDQISSLVGFEQTTNFRRAFKKWTGMSAAAVRKNSVGDMSFS